jgi:hypothetical protein
MNQGDEKTRSIQGAMDTDDTKLIANHVSVSNHSKQSMGALFSSAAEHGALQILAYLEQQLQFRFGTIDTMLLHNVTKKAAENGQLEVIEWIFSSDDRCTARCNDPSSCFHDIALRRAIEGSHLGVVQYVFCKYMQKKREYERDLKIDANLDLHVPYLKYAAEKNRLAILQWLQQKMRHDNDVAENQIRESELMTIAVGGLAKDVVEWLIQRVGAVIPWDTFTCYKTTLDRSSYWLFKTLKITERCTFEDVTTIGQICFCLYGCPATWNAPCTTSYAREMKRSFDHWLANVATCVTYEVLQHLPTDTCALVSGYLAFDVYEFIERCDADIDCFETISGLFCPQPYAPGTCPNKRQRYM